MTKIQKITASLSFTILMLVIVITGLKMPVSAGQNASDQTAAEKNIILTDGLESFTYTGKAIEPALEVKDAAGNVIAASEYTVTFSDNKEIGNAKVTVTFPGETPLVLEKAFKIVPNGTSIKILYAKRKAFKLTLEEYSDASSKKSGKKDESANNKSDKKGKASKNINTKETNAALENISGYEIQYSLSKDFDKAMIVKLGAKKDTKTIKDLKAKKTYYVRVRTYKKVDGEKFYSEWSKTESVKTCKYLVAIDAGHQARANGGMEAVGPGSKTSKPKVAGGATGVSTGLHEYELNLQIALKLQAILEERGYEVVMARTSNDVNITNIERAEIANKAEADCFIRIHANGSTSSSVTGAQTICMTSSSPYNSMLYKKSKKLSQCVLSSYIKATGFRREGVMERNDLSGTNWSKVPVTLIELGYMSNSAEDRKMASSKFQKKMAAGIADGIDAYFK